MSASDTGQEIIRPFTYVRLPESTTPAALQAIRKSLRRPGLPRHVKHRRTRAVNGDAGVKAARRRLFVLLGKGYAEADRVVARLEKKLETMKVDHIVVQLTSNPASFGKWFGDTYGVAGHLPEAGELSAALAKLECNLARARLAAERKHPASQPLARKLPTLRHGPKRKP